MKNYSAPEAEVILMQIDEGIMDDQEDITGVVSTGGDLP